jgi:hypothetical protein
MNKALLFFIGFFIGFFITGTLFYVSFVELNENMICIDRESVLDNNNYIYGNGWDSGCFEFWYNLPNQDDYKKNIISCLNKWDELNNKEPSYFLNGSIN